MPYSPSRSRSNKKRNVPWRQKRNVPWRPPIFGGARRLVLTLKPRNPDGRFSGDDQIVVERRPSPPGENGQLARDDSIPIVFTLIEIDHTTVKVSIEADPGYSVDRGSVYQRKKSSG